LKLLNGNPGRRRLNAGEPKPPSAVPSPPAHLNAAARREWRRMAPLLASLGLLSRLDRAALAAYCATYARWAASEAAIAKSGTIVAAPKSGTPMVNPYLGVAERALDRMAKLLTEFGLTPSSRARIDAGAPAGAPMGARDKKAERHFPDDAAGFDRYLADNPNGKRASTKAGSKRAAKVLQ
jgi:P27 family predicted phage terminase small subunit